VPALKAALERAENAVQATRGLPEDSWRVIAANDALANARAALEEAEAEAAARARADRDKAARDETVTKPSGTAKSVTAPQPKPALTEAELRTLCEAAGGQWVTFSEFDNRRLSFVASVRNQIPNGIMSTCGR